MKGRAWAVLVAALVATSCGGGSDGGQPTVGDGDGGAGSGVPASGGAHEAGAGNPHVPAGGDGADGSAEAAAGEAAGGAGAGAGGDGGAGGIEPSKPPVQSCAPPEDPSRWANGNKLYIGVAAQCGDLKPCFGSIYTATMTGKQDLPEKIELHFGDYLCQESALRAHCSMRWSRNRRSPSFLASRRASAKWRPAAWVRPLRSSSSPSTAG